MGYDEIESCRISKNKDLLTVLNLGEHVLTGIFPKSVEQKVDTGPLELVWSRDSNLLQLKHSFNPSEMYGENYGYRSGLNQSMIDHLSNKVKLLETYVGLKSGDTVLDIGSNDATLLCSYKTPNLNIIGIDPTGSKFKKFYPENIKLIPEFFSAESFQKATKNTAKIITSIAMFYDLEDPVDFARQIHSILDNDGIWHFEQSYMPSMLRLNSYDTICHEHIEYYSLTIVKKILDIAEMKILDVQLNNINGGSFGVTATKRSNNKFKQNKAVLNWMLEQEQRMGLSTPKPYLEFSERVFRHREDLKRLIQMLNDDGKTVFGYGASTKGNVILQFCGFNSTHIPFIAEVNEDKFGRITPGSNIPIISEARARAMKPDYFLVLPWHFKDGILKREKEFVSRGGKFIFPFPEIEIF